MVRRAPSRSRQLLLSVVLLSTLGAAAAQAQPVTRFADVPPTHWAYLHVDNLAAAGLTTGCAPGLYCPDQVVPRREMAVFLLGIVHGAGFDPVPFPSPELSDLPPDHWAYGWAQHSMNEGLLDPCGLTPGVSFCPDLPVSRAEMAVRLLVMKYGDNLKLPVVAQPRFADVPLDHWASGHIELLAAEGLTAGCGDGTSFCPDDPVTRAEVAVFLVNTFDLPIPLGDL